ncbi:MAG: enoyl-CoA hydratase/isomerase family protein [Rickettsiales bacterium]|nr:enoyl-CoA hydratase/isomerase family protein [Rickettsiales bacterium]
MPLITLETPQPQVCLLHLNRPESANALSTALANELHEALTNLPKHTRAVILTGNGRHFCAGADLKDRKGMDEAAWHTQHHALESAREAVLACPVPVIAAVNGAAFGGGLELALACDFIYAGREARFALTETTLGIMPGMGGTQTLPRRIGLARAAEMIWTGKPVSAAEAERIGLVNRLCDDVVEEAITTARIIAANAPLAVRATKTAMREGSEQPLQQALATELRYYRTLLATHDRTEGINAFNDKRPARFKGS